MAKSERSDILELLFWTGIFEILAKTQLVGVTFSRFFPVYISGYGGENIK